MADEKGGQVGFHPLKKRGVKDFPESGGSGGFPPFRQSEYTPTPTPHRYFSKSRLVLSASLYPLASGNKARNDVDSTVRIIYIRYSNNLRNSPGHQGRISHKDLEYP